MLLCFIRKFEVPLNISKSAFTLVELLIVVVIIGALATAAIPSYTRHVERVRASEGVQNLTALLASQTRYQLENAAYATLLTQLDITVAASTNFNAPTVDNNAAALASIQRVGGSYTLSISSTGVVSCAVAASAGCIGAGYP